MLSTCHAEILDRQHLYFQLTKKGKQSNRKEKSRKENARKRKEKARREQQSNKHLEAVRSHCPKTTQLLSLSPCGDCAFILQARSEAMQAQLESTLLQLQELKLQKLELEQRLHRRAQASSAPREVCPFLQCCVLWMIHYRPWS